MPIGMNNGTSRVDTVESGVNCCCWLICDPAPPSAAPNGRFSAMDSNVDGAGDERTGLLLLLLSPEEGLNGE